MLQSGLQVGAKALSGIGEAFDASGVNTYLNWTFARDPIAIGRDAAINFLDDANSMNPDTFRNVGVQAGQFAGAFGAGIFGAQMTMRGMRQAQFAALGSKEVWRKSRGFMQGRDIWSNPSGSMYADKNGLKMLTSEAISDLKKSSTRGFFNKAGKFKALKGMGGPMVGMMASMAAGMMASWAFSKVGGLMDQAAQFDINRRKMHYDTRYFNTQRDEASLHQTIGQAMDMYESKMVSTARLFHNRG